MREMPYPVLCPLDLLNCFLQSIDLKINAAQASEFTCPWELPISDHLACFYIVVGGGCSLRLDGEENVFTLNSGDIAVLLHNKAHTLSGVKSGSGDLACGGAPADFAMQPDLTRSTLIRGIFSCDANEIVALLPEMPPVILANGEGKEMVPWIVGTTQIIASELALAQPGAQAIINDLVHLIFVQGIRNHTVSEFLDQDRMPALFHHPQIGLALYQMQARLEEPWVVSSLARMCGMSRSAFAYEFKNVVGMPPMAYLFEIRMRMAVKLLKNPEIKIKEVCARIGFKSQPTFTHAFSARTGLSPGAYRKLNAGGAHINAA
jgi:AraC-like DNA-binding protein